MTEVPYLILQVELTFEGKRSTGMSADLLPPKWFTKDPQSDFQSEDLPQMLEVITHAADCSVNGARHSSFFRWWQELYSNQADWASENKIAPLLANFGISLIERAVLDAICRASGTTIHRFLYQNRGEIELGVLRSNLQGMRPSDVIVKQPSSRLLVRHTIGIGDPLSDSEIVAEERVDDLLPHSLIDNIRTYGLSYFKIKLSGDQERDHTRLHDIAKVLEAEVAQGARFTMDGNENFQNIDDFRAQYEFHLANPQLASFLERGLLLVEQPLHRDQALSESVRSSLVDWRAAPAIIIDESDADLLSLPRALELGYAGTSHKNCKGITKGILNAATIQHASELGHKKILTAEDLANLGPIALLQDLVIAASLGIPHIERNGHHYFNGLSGFPDAIQKQTIENHSDLFRRTTSRTAAVDIQEGQINISSLLTAPFGYTALDVAELTSLRDSF